MPQLSRIPLALLLAVYIAALAGVHTSYKAHAQADQGATDTESPLRLVLSGPASSPEDQVIRYRLEYQRVNDNPPTGGLVFVYSVNATLVGIRGVEGPAPTDVGPHAQDSQQFGVEGDHGIVEFDVQPRSGFAGELDVGIYIIGTGIELPEGSVTSVTTNVTPRNALPSDSAPTRSAYRYVLRGPASSPEGEVIHYRLQYELVDDPGAVSGGTVFVYTGNAKLVAMSGVEGPSPRDLGAQEPGRSEQFVVQANAGVAQFDVQPIAGFLGPLAVSIYQIGTGIELPEGSVTSVTTNVKPRTALPSTGSAGSRGTSTDGMLPLAALVLLIVGSAAAAPCALGVVRRR